LKVKPTQKGAVMKILIKKIGSYTDEELKASLDFWYKMLTEREEKKDFISVSGIKAEIEEISQEINQRTKR